ELAKKVISPSNPMSPTIDTAGKRAIYNNLNENEELALAIDRKIKEVRPHGWRGVPAKESVIQFALYELLNDVAEVERLFAIIKQQAEY
ncbi:MAG: hypothetical protein QX194_05260, partial [Methylococcales bacterium]